MTEPKLTITSLRWDPRIGHTSGIPYIIFNITFRAPKGSEIWYTAKKESEEYVGTLTIDDPKKYEKWIEESFSINTPYPGHRHLWTYQDPAWQYIEKFDTFWMREWVSDCPVVREAIAELEHYHKYGKTRSVYRFHDSNIILRHLRVINQYWD